MNASRFCKALACFVSAWALAVPALAQQGEEDIRTLSPFTVTSEEDTGYRATHTLSGTRINSELRDVASSIQVITGQFLEDTGVTDTTQLLLYTTSTEVADGSGGNFGSASGSTSQFTSENTTRRSETTPTRIRGLAEASLSRNLYATVIPFDAYNISRVEVNRGANSVLFGLGSPAGILNYNLNEVMWADENKVELRVDQHGSFRAVLDVNKVVAKDVFAVRVVGLNNQTKYRQDPAYKDDQRYYLTATYRPFRDTSISASFEKGWIDSTMPRDIPPRDYFTHFFTTGMVTIPQNTDFRDNPVGPGGSAFIQIDSGAIGNLHIFDGPTSGGSGVAVVQFPDQPFGRGIVNPAAANPARANDFRYRYMAIQNAREFVSIVNQDPQGVSAFALGLVDPTVFNFFKNTIDGRASWQYGRIEAYNLTLRQDFLEGKLGFELGFDKQSYDSGHYDALDGIRGNALMLDVTQSRFAYAVAGDPNSGLAPNPNFLRPLAGSRGNFQDRENDTRTLRATAYLRHDFTERGSGFLAKLLGRQNVTLLLSDYRNDFQAINGIGSFMDYDQLRALGYSDLRARANNTGQLGNLFFLGDSVAGRTSFQNLNLTGFKGNFQFPDQVNINIIRDGANEIQTASVRVHHLHNTPHDQLATGGSMSRDTQDTFAAVLQSYWWDSTLITTLGWRTDSVERFINDPFDRRQDFTIIFDPAKRNPTPAESASEDTLTYSGILRVNRLLGDRMPDGVTLDLHYGVSENFQGISGPRNVTGAFHEAPVGETREVGFSVGFLGGDAFFRANWFKTTQDNLPDPDITQAINTVNFQVPMRLYQRHTLAELNAAGFAMPPMVLNSGSVIIGPRMWMALPRIRRCFKGRMSSRRFPRDSSWKARSTSPATGGSPSTRPGLRQPRTARASSGGKPWIG